MVGAFLRNGRLRLHAQEANVQLELSRADLTS
jgi:hypothetical protein